MTPTRFNVIIAIFFYLFNDLDLRKFKLEYYSHIYRLKMRQKDWNIGISKKTKTNKISYLKIRIDENRKK